MGITIMMIMGVLIIEYGFTITDNLLLLMNTMKLRVRSGIVQGRTVTIVARIAILCGDSGGCGTSAIPLWNRA
jgi:hypothetical protein